MRSAWYAMVMRSALIPNRFSSFASPTCPSGRGFHWAGKSQPVFLKAEILDRRVGIEALGVGNSFSSETGQTGSRIAVRFRGAGWEADPVQPFGAPFKRTNHAFGVPSGELPLPAIHPVGIGSHL